MARAADTTSDRRATGATSKTVRNDAVDTVRLIALLGVIVIHTSPFYYFAPFESNLQKWAFVSISALSRFAVPCFFVLAGYYMAKGPASPAAYARRLSFRLLPVFVVWSVIYLLVNTYRTCASGEFAVCLGAGLTDIAAHPVTFVLEGSEAHLWFLPALLIAAWICALTLSTKLSIFLPALAVVLYLLGLLGGAYSASPAGLHFPLENTRDGPFFSLPLFYTGYLLASRALPPSSFWIGLTMFAVGASVQFVELIVINSAYGASVVQDFTLGTYAMGVGAAMMGLSGHRFLNSRTLGKLGRLTFGGYLVHFAFGYVFAGSEFLSPQAVWTLVFPLLVLSAALLTTACAVRVPILSRFFK